MSAPAADHRSALTKRAGWEPGLDLAIRECHGCGRDIMVAVISAIPEKPRAHGVDLCRDCLTAAVALIDEDAQ